MTNLSIVRCLIEEFRASFDRRIYTREATIERAFEAYTWLQYARSTYRMADRFGIVIDSSSLLKFRLAYQDWKDLSLKIDVCWITDPQRQKEFLAACGVVTETLALRFRQ